MAAIERRQDRRSKKASIAIIEISDQMDLARLQLSTKRYGHRTSETSDAVRSARETNSEIRHRHLARRQSHLLCQAEPRSLQNQTVVFQ
jgi:hypothetical protein